MSLSRGRKAHARERRLTSALPCLCSRAFSVYELAPVNKFEAFSKQPRNCSTTEEFDAALISYKARPPLACIWTNNAGGNEDFWKNQWDTRGACTSLTVEQYFDLAVAFHKLVSVNVSVESCDGARRAARVRCADTLRCSCDTLQATLNKAGWSIGRTIDREVLRAKIKEAWGAIPWIGCYRE